MPEFSFMIWNCHTFLIPRKLLAIRVSVRVSFVLFLGTLQISSAAGVGYGSVVPIPAGERVQYQHLHHAGFNTYKFGYDTGTGPSQSFREEEKGVDGVVRGQYGFINPLGALQIVEYYADHTGFHILGIQKLEPERRTTEDVTTTTTTTPKPPEVTQKPRRLPPFSGPLPPFVLRSSRTTLVT